MEKIFSLMVDIDDEIEEEWMVPKEGFQADDDNDEEDNVNFGKTCVDRLVGSIGDDIMLPLVANMVNTAI